jgi:hypothetical protein
MEPIFTVTNITVAPLPLLIYPTRYALSADGKVGTPGWANPKLAERLTTVPTPDGFLYFDFLGEPPTTLVHDLVTPISAPPISVLLPHWATGIRVFSKTNHIDWLIAPVTIKGMLHTGILGPGGETTGTELEYVDHNGSRQRIEVEIQPDTTGSQFVKNGAFVSIAGKIVQHQYVTRGNVARIVASEITPDKMGGPV